LRHPLCLLLGALACLALAAGPAAAQRGKAYCTVKEIKAEQVSNGVRVIIQTDGNVEWDWDFQELIDSGALTIEYMGEYGISFMPTEKFTHMPLLLRNAKSGLGSAFIPIGKYPVSHAVISIPDWAAQSDGVGLRVDIFNYLGWVRGEPSLIPGYYEEGQYRYGLGMRPSEDRQGVVLLWTSDRFASPAPPKTPEDLPAELSVTGGAQRITVKALNARLQEVANAISARTGLKIDSPPDSDLRVTCGLWNLPPDTAVEVIAAGLGLCGARLADGSWLLAADVAASGGYTAAQSRRLPLKYLRARETLDLLPNYLLKYLRADDEGNALTVSGPEWMVRRVAEDVAKLDAPPRQVLVEVTIVEYTSASGLARALKAGRLLDNSSLMFDSLLGDLGFVWLPGVGRAWSAVLDSLKVESAAKLRSTASLRVLNGHQGRIFAGQQRTVIIEELWEKAANLETVNVGTTLIVQPRLGESEDILLRVSLEANSLRATDPTTGLPEIAQRSAQCSLRVRDNDTVALTGLQLAEETRRRHKIPILGDLPLVGSLFRAPARSESATQLAIFITPHILSQQTADSAALRGAEGEHRSG